MKLGFEGQKFDRQGSSEVLPRFLLSSSLAGGVCKAERGSTSRSVERQRQEQLNDRFNSPFSVALVAFTS